MRIVAVDPGVTTGLCFYAPEFESLEQQQMGPSDHYPHLFYMLEHFHPDVVVCESFQNMSDFRQESTTKPLEYIGIVKMYVQTRICKLVLQSSSEGKQFWDDDKLKRVGLYERGRPHSNDATRHFLYYWTFTLNRNDYLKALK